MKEIFRTIFSEKQLTANTVPSRHAKKAEKGTDHERVILLRLGRVVVEDLDNDGSRDGATRGARRQVSRALDLTHNSARNEHSIRSLSYDNYMRFSTERPPTNLPL